VAANALGERGKADAGFLLGCQDRRRHFLLGHDASPRWDRPVGAVGDIGA
jgi:hypothetical protein